MNDEFYIDREEQHIVNGFLENEADIETGYSYDSYDNCQIEDHLNVYFRLFSKSDLDIIYLYYLSNKKQHEIKDMLEKTQPAISYDVTRIKQQIEFVVRIVAKIDDFVMFIVDEKNGLTLKERELLLVFFYSTSIVKTSIILKQNQITCRTRIRKAIQRLKQLGYTEMFDFFCYILDNLNKIKKAPIRIEE